MNDKKGKRSSLCVYSMYPAYANSSRLLSFTGPSLACQTCSYFIEKVLSANNALFVDILSSIKEVKNSSQRL